MKTIKFLVTAAILGGAITTTPSCGKYEDGPGFSLLTKKARLTGDWDAKEYIDSNGTSYSDNDDEILTFERDGSCRATDGSVSVNGTWEFASDKEKIRTTFNYGGVGTVREETILRLTNKELWTKDEDGGITKYEAKK